MAQRGQNLWWATTDAQELRDLELAMAISRLEISSLEAGGQLTEGHDLDGAGGDGHDLDGAGGDGLESTGGDLPEKEGEPEAEWLLIDGEQALLLGAQGPVRTDSLPALASAGSSAAATQPPASNEKGRDGAQAAQAGLQPPSGSPDLSRASACGPASPVPTTGPLQGRSRVPSASTWVVRLVCSVTA